MTESDALTLSICKVTPRNIMYAIVVIELQSIVFNWMLMQAFHMIIYKWITRSFLDVNFFW